MAFGSDNKLTIEVEVDQQGAISGFKNLEQSVDDVAVKAKSSSSAIDSFFSGLATGAGIAAFQSAIGAVTAGLTALPEVIRRGATVDDISASFEKLSDKAGVAGDVLITKFSSALGDTVSKVDLMKEANELLVGGLDPEQFELVAKAARALGETTGTDAKDGLDKLTDSLLRGNDKALKNLGIVVDNQKAYEDYAKSIGVTADALSEEGKVLATREAVLDALKNKQQELGDVTDDAADRLDQLNKVVTDWTDELVKAVANNKELNDALAALVDVAKEVDLSGLITGVVKFTTALVDAANIGIKGFTEALHLYKLATGDLAEYQKMLNADTVKLNVGLGATVGFVDTNAKTFEKASVKVKDYSSSINKSKLAEDSASKAKKVLADQQKKNEDATKKEADALEKYISTLERAVTGDDRYAKILDQLKGNTLSVSDASKELTNIIKDSVTQNKLAEASNRALDAAVKAVASGAPDAAKKVDEYTKSLKDLADAGSKAASSTGESGGFLDTISGLFEGQGFEGVGQQIGGSILNGIQTALEGGNGKQILGSIGADAGSAIGAAIGGPLGAQLGEMIGKSYGEALSGLGKNKAKTTKGLATIFTGGLASFVPDSVFENIFGGNNAGDKARKTVDKFFSDAFDANRLGIIINGELVKITDLVTKGTGLFGSSADFKNGGFSQYLQSLPAEAQAAFNGVGAAFEELLGVSSDISGQIGAILANNIGGNLNNLQLLVHSTGASFDDLKNAVITAFEKGNLSISEANNALQQVQQISQKGIPGALGDVKQAFDNIKAAGVKGGYALVDALIDVGAEAKELQIKTLPALSDYLVNVAGKSKEEVSQLMAALSANGINSIDKLTNATTEQLLPVLASLQNAKFPFAEAAEQGKQFLDQINQIPEKKSLELEVILSKQSRDNLDKALSVSNSRGPGIAAQ